MKLKTEKTLQKINETKTYLKNNNIITIKL